MVVRHASGVCAPITPAKRAWRTVGASPEHRGLVHRRRCGRHQAPEATIGASGVRAPPLSGRERGDSGDNRRGNRFRDGNRRGAAAAPERTRRGAAQARRRWQMRTRARAEDEGGSTAAPEQRTAAVARQTAVSAASRRARDAQRAKRAETRGDTRPKGRDREAGSAG